MNASSAEKSKRRAGTRRHGSADTASDSSTTTLTSRSRSLQSTQTPEPRSKPCRTRNPKADTNQFVLCKGISQYDDNYFLTILSRVLFPTTLSPDPLERTWPGYLALSAGNDSLAYQCLQSLSRACAGQISRRPEFIEAAQRSYTTCLGSLHALLSDSTARHDDELLIPVIIFGAYEMLFITPSDGWIRHTLGLAALFEIRGPKAFTPCGTAIQVFRNSRQVMIMAALSARKTTFLARSEWMTLPWIVSQTPKDSFELLLDTIVKIPELNVRTHAGPVGDERACVHQEALDVLTGLSKWRKAWEASPEGESLELPLAPLYASTYPSERLGTPIDYPSKYAATCDVLYQGAEIFAGNIALSTLPAGMNGAVNLVARIENAAIQICRSLPYFMTSTYSQRSKLDALWSIHLAWKVLGEGASPSKLKGWLRGQTDECADAFGSWMISPKELGGFIRDS